MINQDFFLALEDLEREKGISQAEFIAALENALVIAYKKSTGTAGGVEVRLNPEKKSIKIYSVRSVVEEVIDPEKEISLADAQEIKKSYKAGDVVSVEIISKNFLLSLIFLPSKTLKNLLSINSKKLSTSFPLAHSTAHIPFADRV